MSDKFLYLYSDENGIIEQASISEIDVKGKNCIKVLADSHDSISQVYNLVEQRLSLNNKKYKLSQDVDGLFCLKQILYIYYNEDGQIKSIGPTKLDDFNHDETIKQKFVVTDEIVSKMIEGKISLSKLQVLDTTEKIVKIIEKENPKAKLWKPNSINKYKIYFSNDSNCPHLLHDKRKGRIYIKNLKKLPETYLWAFLTIKNDPTIILSTAKIKMVENETIIFFGLPKKLNEYDIYSNISDTKGFYYKEI